MKEILKKIKASKNIAPLIIGIVSLLLLEYVIFPSLTAANTLLNLFGGAIAIGLIVVLYYYLKIDNLILTTKEEPKTKKPNPKMYPKGHETDDGKPFVKTRKRKPKSVKEWEDEIDLGGHE